MKKNEKEFLERIIKHVLRETENISDDNEEFMRIMIRLSASLTATICIQSNNSYETLLNFTELVKEYIILREKRNKGK